ncbi:MAG TPA: polysaccharide deacetylase family protein [Syntrophorhabdaceae bacterium]|nr:polysaccharide deacetylase family protein [Syntrophorhabdaceae bacterium]HQM80048.1 polysaccharide deacetylase family protein [Syntrophorhabdaceae bacterium]
MKKTIGIKVDVDTYAGMRKGVPALLAIFRKYNIRASFFVPMGKDHTGRTVKRVFTRKGFLKKAGRVGVLSTYGIRTLMYGLLLPGPEIARKNRHLLLQITEEGHELGIHGRDHVQWHDSIKHLSKERTEKEIGKLLQVYEEVVGKKACSFAAPGWMINPYALKSFSENGLVYSSDTRGSSPFFPLMGGEEIRMLQIPTTLPTLDEVIGVAGTDAASLSGYYMSCLHDGLNILTVHTELEGKKWGPFLEAFIRNAIGSGYAFRRLIDIAREYAPSENTPVCAIEYGNVEGRAGEVCCQVIEKASS